MSYGSRGPKNVQLFRLLMAGYGVDFRRVANGSMTIFITAPDELTPGTALVIGSPRTRRMYMQSQMTKKLNIFIKENLDDRSDKDSNPSP